MRCRGLLIVYVPGGGGGSGNGPLQIVDSRTPDIPSDQVWVMWARVTHGYTEETVMCACWGHGPTREEVQHVVRTATSFGERIWTPWTCDWRTPRSMRIHGDRYATIADAWGVSRVSVLG